MRELIHGALAGFLGVAGMAGAITTLRRALLTNEQLGSVRTHPDKVADRIHSLIGGEGELDNRVRRRWGDVLHYGYGASWGAIYALITSSGRPTPVLGGLALAGFLWILGFGILMPLVGVQRGFWRWGPREYLFTGTAHIFYGVFTALILHAFESGSL